MQHLETIEVIEYYTAAYDTVIAVGSVNESDQLSRFSNYGNEQELVAPGEGILSTYYDGTNHIYVYGSGTSMAAPHVAEVAALAWATHPTFTNQQIRELLRATAIDLGTSGWDKYYGYGKVDAYKVVIYVPPPIPELSSAILAAIGVTVIILNQVIKKLFILYLTLYTINFMGFENHKYFQVHDYTSDNNVHSKTRVPDNRQDIRNTQTCRLAHIQPQM